MKLAVLATALTFLVGPALAQTPAPSDQSSSDVTPVRPMMMGGFGRGPMGRFSSEDMDAFIDAHIAALRAGLKLTPEQESLWPPVEEAMRNLARLHASHFQARRENRASFRDDPVGMLRSMADRMSQGADAMRRLADAANPLYESLDEGQKRRLHTLMRMGPRGMMGMGMMGPRGRNMMRGWYSDDDDDGDDR